jgi:hypothetical protein
VGPTAGLDIEARGKVHCPCRGSKLGVVYMIGYKHEICVTYRIDSTTKKYDAATVGSVKKYRLKLFPNFPVGVGDRI